MNIRSIFAKQRQAMTSAFDGLSSVRQRITVLRDERADLGTRPQPIADAIAALHGALDRQVEKALDALYTPAFLHPGINREHHLSVNEHNVSEWLAVAGGVTLRTALEDRITAAYSGLRPIDAAERQAGLDRIDAEMRDLEMIEERMIREMEAAGLSIMRRGDADPAIVLLTDAVLPE